MEVQVEPEGCEVICYWPDTGRPQYVGSSRHLSQALPDLQALTWDISQETLLGVSEVTGGYPLTVRIYVPEGYRVKTPDARMNGRVAELELLRETTGPVNWQLECEGGHFSS